MPAKNLVPGNGDIRLFVCGRGFAISIGRPTVIAVFDPAYISRLKAWYGQIIQNHFPKVRVPAAIETRSIIAADHRVNNFTAIREFLNHRLRTHRQKAIAKTSMTNIGDEWLCSGI